MGIRDYMGYNLTIQKRKIEKERKKSLLKQQEEEGVVTSTPPFSKSYIQKKKAEELSPLSMESLSKKFNTKTGKIEQQEDLYTKTYGSTLSRVSTTKDYNRKSKGNYAVIIDDSDDSSKSNISLIKVDKYAKDSNEVTYYDKNGIKRTIPDEMVWEAKDLKVLGYKNNKLSPDTNLNKLAAEHSQKLGKQVKQNIQDYQREIPLTERISENIQRTTLAEELPPEYTREGFGLNEETIGNLIGQTISYLNPETGSAKAFQIGEKVASKLASKLGIGVAGKIAKGAVIGGVGGTGIGVAESAVKGESLPSQLKQGLTTGTEFGAVGAGFGAVGGLAGIVKKTLTSKMEQALNSIPEGMKTSVEGTTAHDFSKPIPEMSVEQELTRSKNDLARINKKISTKENEIRSTLTAKKPAKQQVEFNQKAGESKELQSLYKNRDGIQKDISSWEKKVESQHKSVLERPEQLKPQTKENVIQKETSKPEITQKQVKQGIRQTKKVEAEKKYTSDIQAKSKIKEQMIKEKETQLNEAQAKFDKTKAMIKEKYNVNILRLDKKDIAKIKNETGIDVKLESEKVSLLKRQLNELKSKEPSEFTLPEQPKQEIPKESKIIRSKKQRRKGEPGRVKLLQQEVKPTKPTEVKPTKPTEVKPAKPIETKPIETKQEVKPTKPTEVKPTKPGVTKQEVKPTKSTEAKPKPIKKKNKPGATGNKKESEFEQTFVKSEKTTKESKKIIAKRKSTKYAEVSNQKDWEAALQKVEDKPMESLAESINKKSNWTSEDTATALALIERAEKVEDYKTVSEIMQNLTENLSTLGQGIQAASIWNKRTPEGILKISQHMRNKSLEKMNIDQMLKVLRSEGKNVKAEQLEYKKLKSEFKAIEIKLKEKYKKNGCSGQI